jgi:hypothetical protein
VPRSERVDSEERAFWGRRRRWAGPATGKTPSRSLDDIDVEYLVLHDDPSLEDVASLGQDEDSSPPEHGIEEGAARPFRLLREEGAQDRATGRPKPETIILKGRQLALAVGIAIILAGASVLYREIRFGLPSWNLWLPFIFWWLPLFFGLGGAVAAGVAGSANGGTRKPRVYRR